MSSWVKGSLTSFMFLKTYFSARRLLQCPTLPSGSRGSSCEWVLRCVGRVSGLDYYRCHKVRQRLGCISGGKSLAFLFTLRVRNNTWLTPHQSHSRFIIPSHMKKTQKWVNPSQGEEPGDDLQPFPATFFCIDCRSHLRLTNEWHHFIIDLDRSYCLTGTHTSEWLDSILEHLSCCRNPHTLHLKW